MTRLLADLVPRAAGTLVAAALVVAAGACASSPLRRAQQADEMRRYDVAVALYTQAVRKDPDDRDAQLGLERARLRASEAHLFNGRRLSSQGRYEDAVIELQIAAELNPSNADAASDLRSVRTALRSKLSQSTGTGTALQSLLARTRDLMPAGYEIPNIKLANEIVTGQQSTTGLLYRMIGRLAGSLSDLRSAVP